MTEHDNPAGTPGDGPLDTDLLADLHAGVLDASTAQRVLARVRSDPEAAALLRALDATSADLRLLGATADVGAPPTAAVRVPDHVAARLDATLAGLGPAPSAAPAPQAPSAQDPPRPTPAPVVDLAAARARRRTPRWVPAAAAAAVVLVAAVGAATLVVGAGEQVGGTPQAAALPPGVTDLGGAVGPQALTALGSTDFGPLADEATRAACLAANDVPAGTTVLGASEVVLDGRRGVLLLLPGPVPPQLTALVVGGRCAAGVPDTLDRQVIGPR